MRRLAVDAWEDSVFSVEFILQGYQSPRVEVAMCSIKTAKATDRLASC